MSTTSARTRAALLRRGLLFVEPGGGSSPDDLVTAASLELAALGFVPSTRLAVRLAQLGPDQLADVVRTSCATLAASVGADQTHRPLFRSFPDGIPSNMAELWLRRVLVHFHQDSDRPCLFCLRSGTCHILGPCRHVVCDRCFDGSNVSGCPVCGQAVDTDSPFFTPSADDRRTAGKETVTYKLIDLGDDLESAARALFASLCSRAQAMSPGDVDDLTALVEDAGMRVVSWLPAVIPVKENRAIVFGVLLRHVAADAVLAAADGHLSTATDVLRVVAVMSGAPPSLQPAARVVQVPPRQSAARWSGLRARGLARLRAHHPGMAHGMAIQTARFKVAALRRPVRRALLAILERMAADALAEDMLRHRSLWKRLGEVLHPGEHATRFPKVNRAFAIVRGAALDGSAAPPFRSYLARLDQAVRSGDSAAHSALLAQRPGELARRFDHAVRLAGDDVGAVSRVVTTFTAAVAAMATPVLLMLRNHLPSRLAPAPVRVFFPRGGTATAPSMADRRRPLRADAVATAVLAIEAELLDRFAGKARFDDAILDSGLADVMVPFNERTASRAAVALPRGSRLPVRPSKRMRLFLHWCEPEAGGDRTDIDLSIGFYDAGWRYAGVCSYYQLAFDTPAGVRVATSSGDRTSAPFPDGASEFVDLDRGAAHGAGFRYAVMIVNAYSGLAFDRLERAFAGVMVRDDDGGLHFDPRTVELRFQLQGQHGVFMPLVVDLEEGRLHWLDSYSRGQAIMNNVATSNRAVTRVCPELIGYFASGCRPSMLDLARLHAAARCRRVFVRSGHHVHAVVRSPDEPAAAFLARIVAAGTGDGGGEPAELPYDRPVLAALVHGDGELAAGSLQYALFRDQATATIAASDLLS